MFWKRKPKKKTRGMFDPLGRFEIKVVVMGVRDGETHTTSRWIKFHQDSEYNKRMCAENHVDDGVWIGDTFYPRHRVLTVYITGEQRLEEYDV